MSGDRRYNNTRFFIIESTSLQNLRRDPCTGLLMRGTHLVLFVFPTIVEQCRRIDPFPVDLKPFLQCYDRTDPGYIQKMHHTMTAEASVCFCRIVSS